MNFLIPFTIMFVCLLTRPAKEKTRFEDKQGNSRETYHKDTYAEEKSDFWDSLPVKYTFGEDECNLFISHQECTECLDAWVDSGVVFIPSKVKTELKRMIGEKHLQFPPDFHDLYITGQKDIATKLFGDESNFIAFWHYRYLVSGKVIGVKPNGFIFEVKELKRL